MLYSRTVNHIKMGNRSEMSKSFDELKAKIETLSTQNKTDNSELKNSFDALRQDINGLQGKLDAVITENKILRTEIKVLKITVNVVRQESLRCNLIIKGVDEIENDQKQLMQLVTNCINKVEPIIQSSDIAFATRIGRKIEGKKRHILVQFLFAHTRDYILAKKKNVKVKVADISLIHSEISPSQDSVYFDEHLTKENANLFAQARKLRPLGVKYVWVKQGKVLVKIADGEKAIRVWSVDDIQMVQQKIGKESAEKRRAQSSLMDPNAADFLDESMSGAQASPILATQGTSNLSCPVSRANEVKRHKIDANT